MATTAASNATLKVFEVPEHIQAAPASLEEGLRTLRGDEAIRAISLVDWSMGVPVPGRGPLDFRLFPWTEEWYGDRFAYVRRGTIQKATQVGASEYVIRWALYWADTKGDTVLYVLPGGKQRDAFSDERVRGLIRSSDYLSSRVPRHFVDNKGLRQIGFSGFLHLRGSQREADLETTPADEVVLDEYDLLVQRHIPSAEKRLSAPSSRNLLRRVGWPTYTEIGINAHFLRSDQRHWLVKCGKKGCAAELPLHFYEQADGDYHWVDQARRSRVCGKCGALISPAQVAEGRWAAKHPRRGEGEEAEIGYQVGRMDVPGTNLGELIAASKLTRPFEVETFWRKDLGLPYDSAEGRLSLDAIAASVSAGGNYLASPRYDEPYRGSNFVTAGVDVASVRALNVRVSEHFQDGTRKALFIGTVDSFDELYTLLVAMRVDCCCIDHQPEGRYARGIVAKLPGIAFTHSWGDTIKQAISLDTDARHVSTHRTTVIDSLLDSVRQRTNLLPANYPEEYPKHLRAAVKYAEEDEITGLMKVGYKVEQAHDYLQAECYDLAAATTYPIWQRYVAGQQQAAVSIEGDLPGFERSKLGDYVEDTGYSAGPADDGGYSPGYESGDEDGWG